MVLPKGNKMDAITRFDFSILDLIRNNLSCEALDTVMPIITFFGSTALLWIAAAVIMLIMRGYRKNGIMMCVGLALCLLIGNLILKNIIARDRPCWINEDVMLLVSNPADYSFPSAHSMTSFAAAVVLFHTDKRLGVAALIMAALIAFSRLYLYVHFPTDVLAGILMGTALGIAACVLVEKITEVRDKKRSS